MAGRMKNMAGSEEFLFNLKEFLTNRKTKRGETGSMERKNHENDGTQGREEKSESRITVWDTQIQERLITKEEQTWSFSRTNVSGSS